MINQDTICAIGTAQGGAIGTIRVSGPEAIEITDRIFVASSGKKLADRSPYTIAFGQVLSADKEEVMDEVLVAVFHAPQSLLHTGSGFSGSDLRLRPHPEKSLQFLFP